jgi:sulfotransferase
MAKFLGKEMETERKSFFFMAGLPRSGSTLLSSILNQNPRIYSGPSSPVMAAMSAIERELSSCELFLSYPKPEQARQIIGSVLPQYYSDRDEPIIIDKNRAWTNNFEYIQGYFGIEPKIICPVRDTAEILTSFISMIRRNPFEVQGKVNFIDEMLLKSDIPLTDSNRCQFLAGPYGILGQSVEGIRKVLMEGYDRSIHFVEYKDLVEKPEKTLEKIYDFLGEEAYEHNFSSLENKNRELDAEVYGIADMHEVRPILKATNQKPEEVLPEDILSMCQNTEFWRTSSEDSEESIFSDHSENEDRLIGA